VLIPKKLKFKAVGRFVEEQVLDFTALGSFIQVDAKNNNTGGSSGSGKTTLFRVLEYNLGLNDLSTSLLQSRLTKDSISTTGEYDWDGTPVIIERNKSKLSITVGDQVTTGSSKITEEKLDEILGMPRDLFRKILHKRQGEGGFFLDMGPSDVHKFLTSCLKLEDEQKKILKLDDILKNLSSKEISLKSEVESNRMGLEASRNALNSLGETPKPSFNADYIELLKIEHLNATDRYDIAASAYHNEKMELERSRPITSVSPFDRSSIEKAEVEIKEIQKKTSALESAELSRQSEVKSQIEQISKKIGDLEFSESSRQSEVRNKITSSQLEISNLQKIEQNRQAEINAKISTNRLEYNKASNLVQKGDQAKEEAKKLAVELNKIRASICPTCEQGWITESVKTKEAEILNKLGEHRATVLAGAEAQKTKASLNEQHAVLLLEVGPRTVPEINDLTNKIAQLRLDSTPKEIPEVSGLKAQIVQLRLDGTPKVIPEVLELKGQSELKEKELQAFRQQERDHQSKENTKNQEILAEFARKQTQLVEKHEPNIKAFLEQKNKALSDREMAELKIRSFEAELKRYLDSSVKLNTQFVDYAHIVTQKSTDLVSIQEEIEIVEESKKAIKSHLSCSFDDALESIGDKATRLIRLIPNMSNATIQFEGTKETKEGKVKEEVVCMVSMDGEIGVPLKSLSGGERSSCDMCVDLSIIKFIEETTGKGIGMYIIDEGFNGLDTTCIQDALEMLREYSVDKKLFLVEHNPIVSESIENRILVVRDGLTSKIIQQ
jgi:DNA repair exonuclease SbcCD ATPase subunit